VTLGESECAALTGCTFYVQIWLMSSPETLLDETIYVASQNNYTLCARGPVYYEICPKLVQRGPCDPNTLTQTPICTTLPSFPYWGSDPPVSVDIDPYCWTLD